MEIAYTKGYGYNGSRNIFFNGVPVLNEDGTPKMYSDKSGLDCDRVVDGKVIEECKCPPTDLILAPEDALVARY
uniref:Uncharacterized protein n=1 Tax=viral metagenome TaxID=1070528 RepID=A0A6M3IEX9_9ZZZZ